MIKKILVLILVLILVGCAGKTTTKEGDTTTTVDKESKTITQTVDTEEGKQTTTVKGTEGADSWCPEGGNWEFNSAGAQGAATGEWKVDKLITTGKYTGLCHVEFTFEGPEGKGTWDYYFSEDGESGYFIMEMNGQTFEQEWKPE